MEEAVIEVIAERQVPYGDVESLTLATSHSRVRGRVLIFLSMIKFTFSKIWGIVLLRFFLGDANPLVQPGQYLENRPKVKSQKVS